MVKTLIICPACEESKVFELNNIKNDRRGITSMNIESNQVCSHSFIVYLDNNLAIRDSILIDFQVKIPEINLDKLFEKKKIPDPEELDGDLIKMKMHALTLASILRACFFNKKMLILNNDDFLTKQFQNFFQFIFKQSFNIDIIFKKGTSSKRFKKLYKNRIILHYDKEINNNYKIINPKTIKIEINIVQKFFAEYNANSSLIILKNEIQKAYMLSKKIIDIVDNYKGKEKLGKKQIINELENSFQTKILSEYFEFLLEIIRYYFNKKLSNVSDFYYPKFFI